MLNCEYCNGSGGVASGDELRVLRESRGKTAREVAGAMGVSGQYVCDLEKGRRGCSAEVLRRYEEAVGGRLGGGGEAEPAKQGKVGEGGVEVEAKKKEQAVPVCGAGSVREARSSVLQVRVTAREKESFEAAARVAGIAITSWARERLRMATTQELQRVGQRACFLEFLEEVEGGEVAAGKKEEPVPVREAGESVAPASASGDENPAGKKVSWENALAQRAKTQQRTWGFKSEAEKEAEGSSSKKKG